MKFKSRKSPIVYILFFFSIAIMVVIPLWEIFGRKPNITSISLLLFVAGVIGLLLWILYGTHYILTENVIIYRSGPLKGKIPLGERHTIIKEKNLCVGLRPATATKGLIIKYNKYDEIYLSPNTNENFIREILKIKTKIQIVKGSTNKSS